MDWKGIAVGIIPSIGLGAIFWFAMRAVIRADRNERNALARIEAEQDAAAADAEVTGSADVAGNGNAEQRQSPSEPPAPHSS